MEDTTNTTYMVKGPSEQPEVMRRSDQDDLTLAVFPTYVTFKEMLDGDMRALNDRTFSAYNACIHRSLRKPQTKNISRKSHTPKCHRRLPTAKDCSDAHHYIGQLGSLKAGHCDEKNAIKICTLLGNKNYKREDFEISCDASPCKGKLLSLGLFNKAIGKIKWRLVRIHRLTTILKKHIVSSTFAPGFALLKCDGGQAIQVLSFPKVLKRMEAVRSSKKRKQFNINIIVEDSVSRAHFYRTLLKTQSTFRDIIYTQTIRSTVLEFEKVQSVASNTHNSLLRLFTGQKYLKSKMNCEYGVKEFRVNDTMYTCTYGIEEMFQRYRAVGFSTLLQEDHCWYDYWGSFLDPRKKMAPVKDEETRRSRWKDFVEIVKKSGRGKEVEDYGMSILSCDVYKKYKVTNPFTSKSVPNVCFAGQHYASFFMEYLKKYTNLNDMAAQPFIAYTHLLTSHDTNARRIVNDDESLADFFRHAAHLNNTITIFTADHGGKATRFAAYTTQGREELFQPFLFIIVPHQVSNLLGPNVMNALVVNQNRLIGFEDLYHTLVSIFDIVPKTTEPNTADTIAKHSDLNIVGSHLQGLFKSVALNRTCDQMNLNSDVLCLCDGMDISLPSNSDTVQWVAEFALGTLNNRIQEQYTAGFLSKPGNFTTGFYGYGACQRYKGTRIMRARNVVAGREEKVTFSLLAKPLNRKTVEIFDVEVLLSLRNLANGLTLKSFVRVSPFHKFEKCADKGVDPKLCACHADQHKNTIWRNKLYFKIGSQKSFGLKPRTQILDEPCLAIISRTRMQQINKGNLQKCIDTYEAVNACSNVMYKLAVSFKIKRYTRVSLKHPISFTLFPRTVTFLMTAKIGWKYGKFVPKFKFERTI